MITVPITLTKEDYISYYTYVKWDAPENSKKRWIHYIRQFIPILAFAFAFYYTGLFRRDSIFILLIAGFLALTSLMAILGVRSNIKKQAEKVTDDPANHSLFISTNLQIADTGITASNELVRSHFQWKSFIRYLENDQYYFLFISSIQALIVPKRSFLTSADKEQFEKTIRQHVTFEAEFGQQLKS